MYLGFERGEYRMLSTRYVVKQFVTLVLVTECLHIIRVVSLLPVAAVNICVDILLVGSVDR